MTKKNDYGTFEEFIQKITNPSTPLPENPKSLDDGRLNAHMKKIGVIK